MKILLLEDDPLLSEILEEHLVESGHKVRLLTDGDAAEAAALEERFDLFLLDVNVPGIDGMELLEGLRRSGITTPAVFITSLTGSADLKKGFEIGANDYIRKPFEPEELDARIENIRRTFRIEEGVAVTDGITYSPMEQKLSTPEGEISLKGKDGEVLAYLLRHRGRTVSGEELSANLWAYGEAPGDATIRTYIKHLRKVLGEGVLVNVRGEGYRID